jgi:hypothetical protein
MENGAAERLGHCGWRDSVISRNGEWRMTLRNDWDSVVGVIRLYRETENGEWRTVAQQLSILLSPFSILHSPFSFLLSPSRHKPN